MNYNGFDTRLLFNIPLMSLIIAFLIVVLHRRWRLYITILVLAGGVALAFLSVAFIPYRLLLLRETIGIIALFAFSFLVFSDKWPRILFAVSSAYLCLMMLEILLSVVFPDAAMSRDWLNQLSVPVRIRVLTFYLFSFAVFLVLLTRVFQRKTSRFSAREWLLFISFPIGQFLMLALWELSASQSGEQLKALCQVLAVAVSIAADTALYFAISGMSQRAELRAQNALLSKQIDIQKQHYAALTAQYEKIRVIRHDIANHVHTIQILLESGDMQSATEYAGEAFQQSTFHSSLGTCENPIVDAFVYSRMEEARAQGIPMDADVRLPYRLGIANTDVITIFGNLLDNATEACLQLPADERYLRLTAGVQGNFLAIRTENSVRAENGGSRIQRIDGLERGLGARILGDIARQYHGAFEGHADGNRYVTAITLQMDGALL